MLFLNTKCQHAYYFEIYNRKSITFLFYSHNRHNPLFVKMLYVLKYNLFLPKTTELLTEYPRMTKLPRENYLAQIFSISAD